MKDFLNFTSILLTVAILLCTLASCGLCVDPEKGEEEERTVCEPTLPQSGDGVWLDDLAYYGTASFESEALTRAEERSREEWVTFLSEEEQSLEPSGGFCASEMTEKSRTLDRESLHGEASETAEELCVSEIVTSIEITTVIETIAVEASAYEALALTTECMTKEDRETMVANSPSHETYRTEKETLALSFEKDPLLEITEIVEITTENGILEELYVDLYARDAKNVVYNLTLERLEPYYDVFTGSLMTDDGTRIYGIGFTDYTEAYVAEDGRVLFACGFIGANGERIVEIGKGNEILRSDNASPEEYGFCLSYTSENFVSHFVLEEHYVRYGVLDGGLFLTEQRLEGARAVRKVCDTSLGDLYSFDENRLLYTASFGNYVSVTGTPLYELVDFDAIKAEVDRVIDEQDLHYSVSDVQTAVYIAQDALEAYMLSLQEETFLGYRVEDLLEISEGLDPMEYVRITADGIALLAFTPTPPPTPTGLMKWLTGICAGIAVIGAVALSIACPVAAPLAGIVAGAAIEGFSQVVVQNISVENINWAKVGIASVAGAISALPGVGICADALIGGCTEAVFTLMDGGTDEDAMHSFAMGTVLGLTLGFAFDLAGKGLSKVITKAATPGKLPVASVADDVLDGGRKIVPIDDPDIHGIVYSARRSAEQTGQLLQFEGTVQNAMYEVSDLALPSNARRIAGTPGVVTGGDSKALGRNMLEEMGLTKANGFSSKQLNWGNSGYQAHHIIPKEARISNHPVIQKIGMDFDDAGNGIFLKKPNDGINVKSIHSGYHGMYSDAIVEYLDSLDVHAGVDVLERQVADLQASLKRALENGTPLYAKKKNAVHGDFSYKNKGGGATEQMWKDAIESIERESS